MRIIKLIKNFFSKKEKLQENYRQNIIEPDFIDYDGMGNQGRFPARKKS